MDFRFLSPTPLSATSDKTINGAEVSFFRNEELSTHNLLSIFFTTQLSITGGTPVLVAVGFLFTIDNLARENNAADGAITFDIGDSSDVVAASGPFEAPFNVCRFYLYK